MTIKVEFSQEQADFLARMLASFLMTTTHFKFDPSVKPVRHDAQACKAILKAAGASEK